MQPFDIFRRSLEPLKARIAEAKEINPQNMSQRDWAVLSEIFQGIKIMASGTSLVGNSKVMHHLMPNIVPPIDRKYTLRFLRGNTNIKNDKEWEWDLMKEIMSDFFIPLARDTKFHSRATKWIAQQDRYPWDTSVMKVVDNLVIGSGK